MKFASVFRLATAAISALLALPVLAQSNAAAPVPLAETKSFESCIADFQRQARDQQLPDYIQDVLAQLKHQPRVIELDRAQPEFTQTFADYMQARVTRARVKRARELYREYRPLLDQLTNQYGIPGQYLVAFWGLETNFGSYLGKMPTLDSLATLACDERRSTFFSNELFTALRILDRESLQASDMRGSWAGAMGHTQFMPSAYERYAIDGSGDGKIDLWNSREDALTSAANFLNQLGWQAAERWGREVKLPASFPYQQAGLEQSQPVSHWRKLGVRRSDGELLPDLEIPASIVLPMGHSGLAFVVYENFRVIMRWNFSESYALAVGHLADRTAGGAGLAHALSADTPALNPALIRQLQEQLNLAGFDTGDADGIIGAKTRTALRAFQRKQGLVADGYPGYSSFTALGISLETTP